MYLPGKQVVRCSISASCVTGFLAEFIVEMAKHRISPRGINCDWLIGDILMGDTSPTKKDKDSIKMHERYKMYIYRAKK